MPRGDKQQPRFRYVRTRDGWRLATYRYWGGTGSSRWGPVVLVHGLGANRYNLDAPHLEISPARYLAARGHDVWVVELRGSGRSRPPLWPLRRTPFDFDDYVHLDVPALIRHILDETGRPALHWVGHSMGGMLAYAALEHYDQRLFQSVVTLGSPGFTGVRHPLVDILYRLRFMLNVMSWVPQRRAGRLASLFPGLLASTVGPVIANPSNMDRDHVQELARIALTDLPATLLEQFSDWYNQRTGFCRGDGLLDYVEHLSRIRAPILIVAGAGDALTPLSDLTAVYELIASPDKRLLVCGRAQGFSADYGHIDLVLGTHARAEVYPHIAGWIESHPEPPAGNQQGVRG
jgi:pimeloyl-ACP methyl ester carboxylesterase